jgi:hypothetical protein
VQKRQHHIHNSGAFRCIQRPGFSRSTILCPKFHVFQAAATDRVWTSCSVSLQPLLQVLVASLSPQSRFNDPLGVSGKDGQQQRCAAAKHDRKIQTRSLSAAAIFILASRALG